MLRVQTIHQLYKCSIINSQSLDPVLFILISSPLKTPHPARYLLPPTDSRSLGLASGDLPHCGQAGDSFPPEGLSAQRWPLGTSRTA